MRISSFIPTLAVLVTAVVGAALPTDDSCGSELGCARLAHKRHFVDHSGRNIRGLTNAQLIRRGLPLNPPVLRRGAFVFW